MYAALSLFADLDDADIDWILSTGSEQQIIANTALTEEGQPADALHIVLEGLLGVRVKAMGAEPIGTLGPGEIVGEMSFIEGRPASATVQAIENSLILTLRRSLMDEKLRADSAFGARLFRAFAKSLSRRLREANAALGRVATSRETVKATAHDRWRAIEHRLEAMKKLLADADQRAIKNDDAMPEDVAREIRHGFDAFTHWINEQIGDKSSDPPDVRQELGARLQREVLPYLILTRNGERWYSKPRGYAGDFLSIEWMYEGKADGAGRLGPVLDQCFLDLDAAQAVVNRRALLCEEIAKTLAEKQGQPANVLTMACGPAREIFDTFENLSDPSQLAVTCLDIDLQALAFVGDHRDRKKLKKQIRLENANLVYLATGRTSLDLPPQDLAYSIGLIDYFNDTFVIRLLNYVYDRLRPGGRVILGNFHPDNPTKALMDYVLDWKLIHRDEADMNRLFAASKFGRPCAEIRFEPKKVNLFAIGIKEA